MNMTSILYYKDKYFSPLGYKQWIIEFMIKLECAFKIAFHKLWYIYSLTQNTFIQTILGFNGTDK